MAARSNACVDGNCGFESRRGHICLSLVNVVCCQVEVPASGCSLEQRSLTEGGVSECDHAVSIIRGTSLFGQGKQKLVISRLFGNIVWLRA